MRRILAVILIVVAVLVGLRLSRPVKIRVDVSDTVPLAADAVVRTRVSTRLSFAVPGLHGDDLVVTRDEPARRHEVDILGLYPDRVNRVRFRLEGTDGFLEEREVAIRTEALPEYYPDVRIEALLPGRIADGMTFMVLGHYDAQGTYKPLPSAIDRHGEVRWYYDDEVGHLLRRTAEGNLIIQEDDAVVEITMLGEPTGRRWEVPRKLHHDAMLLPDGNLLALSEAPGSFDDGLVEIDGDTGAVVREADYRTILDPDRPRQPVNLEEIDWLHLNGLDYDESRGWIIVSGRDQSAIVATDRFTGQLQWILGSHQHWSEAFSPFLLESTGAPFEWQWGQHAPMVHPEDPNRILIYDNGNKRSYDNPLSAEENYSRAVEYEIDPEGMTVRQLWEFGTEYGSELYTPFIGDADYLSNGNRLVTFGGITRTLDGAPTELFDYQKKEVRRMKISARLVEVTADQPAEEVWSAHFADPDPDSYRGYRIYRAIRMPLYPE